MTVVGFILFMGGILSRIFGGAGQGMTHADVEDLGRFTVKQAKDAWRQRAWRSDPRWRSNFVVMGGVLLFAVGLFGIFVVTAPAGIKLLCGGAIIYAAVRTIGAFARA